MTFKFAEPIGGVKTEKLFLPTVRQNEILRLLSQYALNSAQISEQLNGHPSVRLVQKDLVRLERVGFVYRSGKARSVVFSISK